MGLNQGRALGGLGACSGWSFIMEEEEREGGKRGWQTEVDGE